MPGRRARALLTTAVVALAAACGTTTPTSTPTPTPTATSPPTESPTATPAPDTLTVAVLGFGVGTFDLATIPVVLVRNTATRHGAAGVVVHFQTFRGSTRLGALDSVPVNLGPGEIIPVTGDCTDACTGATSVAVSVRVGTWPLVSGVQLAAGAASYTCQPCRAGHGFGDVHAMITAPADLGSGVAVEAFASCTTRSGTIVGGGAEQLVWGSTATRAVDVPVIVNAPPASCRMGASTGW